VTRRAIDPKALARLEEWGGSKLVGQMIHLFLSTTPERMLQIRKGLEVGDILEVERGAHSLKSSAANLGAERLRELASDLEERAHRGDLRGAEELLPDLETAHSSAARILETLAERPAP